MKNTIRLITTSLFGLALMATAQTAHPKLPAEAPAPSTKQVPKAANGREITADVLSADAIQPELSIGWNTIHPTSCEAWNGYLYVYYNGGSFWTNNSVFQALISPACQTGNYLQFYVYNSSGNWSAVYAYPYK